MYEHYRVAIELEVAGSNNWNWCSLCLHEYTFSGEVKMNQHFHQSHSICARSYGCSKRGCKFTTPYPSEMRIHIKNCTREYKEMLGNDIDHAIVDAYADFIALRISCGHILHLIQPGIPSSYGMSKEPKKLKRRDERDEEPRTKKVWGPGNGIRNQPDDASIKQRLNWRVYDVIKMDILNKKPQDVSQYNLNEK